MKVTYATRAGEAFILEADSGQSLLYDRSAGSFCPIDDPQRVMRQGSWRQFDGDPEPIIRELAKLTEQGSG